MVTSPSKNVKEIGGSVVLGARLGGFGQHFPSGVQIADPDRYAKGRPVSSPQHQKNLLSWMIKRVSLKAVITSESDTFGAR
jgi:hypothetical protein